MTDAQKEVRGFNVQTELKFEHFPAYAQFLLENHLDEYVKGQLAFSREVNIPLLKYFKDIPEEELIIISTQSTRELFTGIATHEIESYIQNATDKWIENSLPLIERDHVVADDITLISYIRKKTLTKFLPYYTNDIVLSIKIIDESDRGKK